ncbi:DUF805 domain-containing protein [Flavobacterium sp. PL002]
MLLSEMSLDNETIFNLFYINIIILPTFVPIQAIATRRLRDLNINLSYVFINMTPILSLLF